MKAKNQLVVLSGILVLLATATIAANYNVQPANAVQPANTPNAYGKDLVSPEAKAASPNWGSVISPLAQNGGIGDIRANGLKFGDHNFGQGSPNPGP